MNIGIIPVAGVAAALVALAACTGPPEHVVTIPAPPAPSSPPVAAPQTPPAPPTTSVRDIEEGTYPIGPDLPPGVYHTGGSPSGVEFPFCYWARLSSPDGRDIKDIIASGTTNGPGTADMTVTIEPTDKAFRTNGCSPWVRVP